MAGFGSRVLPSLRLGTGTPHQHTVVRGGTAPTSTAEAPPTWGPAPLWMPDLGLQQFSWHQQDASAVATVNAVGVAAVTVTGTPTTLVDASGAAASHASAAAINSDAGWAGPASHLQTRLNPTIAFSIRPRSANSAIRYWLGIFSADPMASDSPTAHYAAFRYSTLAADAGWKAFTNDGTASAPTQVGATQAAPSTATRENLLIAVKDAGTIIEFWRSTGRLENGANLTYIGAATTDLPTTSTGLQVVIKCRTLDAVSKGIGIHRAGGFFS